MNVRLVLADTVVDLVAVNTADSLIEAAADGLGIVRMMSYQAAAALPVNAGRKLSHPAG